jgi:hypothetical protein
LDLKLTVKNLLALAKLHGTAQSVSADAEVAIPSKPAQVARFATVASVSTTAPTIARAAAVPTANSDEDAELNVDGAAAQARERERARCAAILESAGAARNPVLAASLAFGTSMSRSDAIATLDAMPEQADAPVSPYASRNSPVYQSLAQAAGWERAFKQVNKR